MSTTIGAVDFIAGLDGTLIPSQARALGERIGRIMGQGATRSWQRQLESGFVGSGSTIERIGNRLGDRLGIGFSRGLRQLSISAGNALDDIGELRQIRDVADDFDDAGERISRFGERLRSTWSGVANANDRVWESLDRIDFRGWADRNSDALDRFGRRMYNFTNIMDRMSFSWKDLGHNTRQWTLIIGAVAAAFEMISVLGSAAGAGLIVFGASAASAVIGLGGLVAVFTRLAKPLDELPAALRPVAAEFKNFGKELSRTADIIAGGAFSRMPGVFDSLSATVRGLDDVFRELGENIGDVFADLASAVRPGERAFLSIQKLIRNAGPNFKTLSRIAGTLGLALIDAFNRAQPYVEEFLGWLDDLVESFDDFVQSDGFDEWMRNAQTIFGSVGDLLKATGQLFDDLVTPDSVGRTKDFLDNLTEFMPHLTNILDVLGRLDPFGLFAEALVAVGDALEPLAGPLQDFADGLNTLVSIAIDTFAGQLSILITPIVELANGIDDFMNANPKLAASIMETLGVALGTLGTVISVLAVGKFVRFIGAFVTLGGVKGLASKAVSIAAIATAIGALADVFDQKKDLDSNLGMLSGALLGMRFGPVGALAGALAGLIASMIDDIFGSPETQGSWAKGWEQLFDPTNYDGAVIGELKKFFQRELMGPTEGIEGSGEGWVSQVITGWTTELNNFRTTIQTWSEDVAVGWQGFLQGLQTDHQTYWGDISTRWADTLETMKTDIANWWADLSAGWNTFWGDVGRNIETGWARVTGFFSTAFNTIRVGWALFWALLPIGVASAWSSIVSTVTDGINGIINQINRVKQPLDNFLAALSKLTGGFINIKLPNIPNLPRAASGMITNGPTLAGEAGRELIIPLERPLSQINPEVRAIAELLRGQAGGGSGGRHVTVAEGAVQIVGVRDPLMAGIMAIDELVAKAG